MVDGARKFEVIDEECVGCNLCVNVCPVENCITMEQMAPGTIDPRTNKVVEDEIRQLDNPSEQSDGGARSCGITLTARVRTKAQARLPCLRFC
jgi:Na+-translocating ferredoxin:NAD+ oxidoreductase RNF subunit RnfB